MTPEQRFDIVLYRLNSAKSLLDEIKDHYRAWLLQYGNE